ncbi:glutathione S-transferase 1-1 [Phlebotomus argentipes]|uniref:glutathione S-transferase 1-1 n=1 Tax=Phlebotomus argentipes TaxID=94469 RepID=UPI0028935E41|nr:glutathione S-transferase 1-1 [Phlebotomus argentipes]
MKLYAVSDGPPSLAVRMALKALDIPFELVSVNYMIGEHMTDKYAEMNPQKEIPVLDDDGFYLPETVAILQYLCDKYRPDSELYPKDPKARAIVNHRLCFNSAFYYSSISMYALAPIFYDYKRTEGGLKRLHISLATFETYLKRSGTKYAAADHVTIADFTLITATCGLEAINFSLDEYPVLKNWYETFKKEYPDLWAIAEGGMKELAAFEKNPPDLSHINHPIHPVRKN